MAAKKPTLPAGTPNNVRDRSYSVPDSFCFAQDFLDASNPPPQAAPRQSSALSKISAPPEDSWDRFLVDCGVDNEHNAVIQAVKVTVKRHLEKCGKVAKELPGGEGYDLTGVSQETLSEIVSLVRRALVALGDSRK